MSLIIELTRPTATVAAVFRAENTITNSSEGEFALPQGVALGAGPSLVPDRSQPPTGQIETGQRLIAR